MPKTKKLHHHIVAGLLLVKHTHDDGEETISQIPLNTMLRTDIKNIGLRAIGKAQQSLQMTLHNRLHPDGSKPQYQIIDVIIQNLIYCGHMSNQEFYATPGAELREIPANDPFAGLPLTN